MNHRSLRRSEGLRREIVKFQLKVLISCIVLRPRDDSVAIVERLLVSLDLGEYACNACGNVRFGCDLLLRGHLMSSDPRQYNGILCSTVKDSSGSINDGCSVLLEGGTTRITNAKTSLYANLLCQTQGRLFNAIGTTVKWVACVNTIPFAFGPGSPARQGAGHE